MSGLLLLRRPSYVTGLSFRLSQVRHYAVIGKPQANNEPRWALPKTPARTRFAPSPTGYLHLGSLRTAFYNYLLARATCGQFIIRLEDTDQTRLINDAEDALYDDLRWAGLHWDEGPDIGGPFGPYKQSRRLDIYTQHATTLLESGHAFRCFCTKEDLELNVKRATSSGGVAHYPGTCLHIEQGESDRRAANGEPHVVRFRAAKKPVAALDVVYGTYKKAEREDDFIIMKSDGFPTYHFANVVDDHLMKITHVIRGAEWLISTPKHVELYNAFGWEPPSFAHVGLLVDAQRQKLSKRDMTNIGIGVYRANRIIPEALLNFSALLGWDPNLRKNTHLDRRGVMSVKEMSQDFTLKFTRGDIIVDLSKLKFFQKQLTSKLITGENPDRATLHRVVIHPILAELKELDRRLQEYQQHGVGPEAHLTELYESIVPMNGDSVRTEDYVLQVVKAWKGAVDDPFQFIHDNIFAFYRPTKKAMRKKFHELQANKARIMMLTSDRHSIINADISRVLRRFTHKLKLVQPARWTAEELGSLVKELTDSVKFYDTSVDKDKFESAGWAFLRHGLLNGAAGSAVVPLMLLMGQDETVYRIRDARKIATAEEDRMRSEAQRKQIEEEDARQVRIWGMGDSPQRKAKGNVANSTGSRDFELRNVKITVPPKKKDKAPQPPGSGPFDIYLQKEKEIQEGSFKAQPPAPPPPRSPPRDPSEVERAPQFLSYSEFRFGMRRITLPKEPEQRQPSSGEIGPLSHQGQIRHQDLYMPEKAQAQELTDQSNEGSWAVPKSTPLRPKDSQPRSQLAALPKGQMPFIACGDHGLDRHDYSQYMIRSNRRLAVERSQTSSASGPMDTKSATGGAPRDNTNRVKKPGPFKPAAGEELPVDVSKHIGHLRALNRSLHFRRSAAERLARRGMDPSSTTPTRLEQLQGTGLSPMSQLSRVSSRAEENKVKGAVSASGVTGQEDLDCGPDDGEQATALPPKSDGVHAKAKRHGMESFGNVWGTNSEVVDYQGQRQAAVERTAQWQAREEEKASLAQIEKQLARQWADRND